MSNLPLPSPRPCRGARALLWLALTLPAAACTPPAAEDFPPPPTTAARTVATGAATTERAAATSVPAVEAIAAASAEPAATASAAAPSAREGVRIAVASTGEIGPHLTDGDGRTVYLTTRDTPTASACVGECTRTWPPVLTAAAPAAGDGADLGLLDVVLRDDGGAQVAYNGHRLYYFSGDGGPGTAEGHGSRGEWFAVPPAGEAIGGR